MIDRTGLGRGGSLIDRTAWIEKLRGGDRHGARTRQALSREFLGDTLDLVERYARIEKVVLGGVDVTYSQASLKVDLSPSGDPAAQGESLAQAERRRLDLPAGPVLDLQRLIEKQGIKVVPRQFPGPGYAGGFFFDAQLGPCILVDTAGSDSETLYTLAHQFGHFLADFDPYITTLCGWPSASAPMEHTEARAHAMALSFLMPREDLELYRQSLGAEAAVSGELLRHLHVYFELDLEVIVWRLLMLGWIEATALRELLDGNAALAAALRQQHQEVASKSPPLPGRFVRLVASAFGSGRLDLDAAATYFGTDAEAAERILGQFEYESGGASRERPKRGNGSP